MHLINLKFIPLLFLSFWNVQAGEHDTISQLAVAFGNIDMTDSFEKVPVDVEMGTVPLDLEGTLIRHGCGVFGYATSYDNEDLRLNRIQHIFDCIEMAQAYSFADGRAIFTSKFYDTAKNDIYR